jgi:ABC-type Fe3+/spermidine/putrescine transport system ATPase subunit
MKWLNSPNLDKDDEIPSSKLRLVFATIIKELSVKLGIQFIIITCDEELLEIKDKVFVIDQDKNGVSYVQELCD